MGVMEGLNRVNKVIEDPSFRPPKLANVPKLIENSEEFNNLKKSIEDCLKEDFDRCQEYANQTFFPLRDIREFIRTWNIDTFKSQEGDIVVEASKLLNKLEQWKEQVRTLVQKRSHGMVHVDGSKPYSLLITGIETASNDLKQFLKKLAEEKIIYINDKSAELKKNLDPKDYTIVSNFCKLIVNCKESKNILAEIENIKKNVLEKTLTALKRNRREEHSFGGDDVPKLQDAITKINSDSKSISDAAERAGEMINKHKRGVTEALEREISDLKKDISIQIGNLDQENLLNPDLEPENAIDELNRCQRSFAPFKNKVIKNKEFNKILDMGDLKVKEADEYEKRYNAKMSLWEYRKKWKKLYREWMETDLRVIDSEVFAKDFDDHWRRSAQLKIELGKDKKEPVLELSLIHI
eukprot:TRINITY_DN4132_c0_g1_i9.p1 TRINITY_DN4132_c0_g1~~TRINITY_DN4132_c0_g1_i9.p1  ORF type:complete len:409 (-),score=96.93 TRINITY_DN4132_c0_g1_i9:171-1397(-)